MRRLVAILAGASALTVASTATAGDPAAGAEKAKTVCAACHGADGNTPTSPDFPRLGGQHYDYLLHSLRAYKKGTRKNAIMAGQVETLTQADLANLAAYYAAQKGPLHVIPLHRTARGS